MILWLLHVLGEDWLLGLAAPEASKVAMLSATAAKLMEGFGPLLQFALSRPRWASQELSLESWRDLLKKWGFTPQNGALPQAMDAVTLIETVKWSKVELGGAWSELGSKTVGRCLQFLLADEVEVSYALNVRATSVEQPCPDKLAHHHIAAVMLTPNLQYALLLAEVRSIDCGDDAASVEGLALFKLIDDLPFCPLGNCLQWRDTPFELTDLAAGWISLDVDETLNPFSLLIRF